MKKRPLFLQATQSVFWGFDGGKMKKLLLLLLVFCCALTATGCSGSENEEEEMKEIKSVLFIGNSYTYYNDMPTAIFENFTKAAGKTVSVTAITKGSWTLEKFANPEDEYGARVEAALSGETKYDLVILQEQSLRPAIAPEKFHAAVENLTARIRKTGAQVLLYSTWGRHSDSADLEKNGLTNETMTYKLAASYDAIGKKLNIPVAHAGLAFREIYTGESGIGLYNPDLSHPSYAGSYLAAATLYAKIFGDEAPAFESELSAEVASILRQAAENAVKNPMIPAEYSLP